MSWSILFSLLGGLGLFLFGMKLMSEGLEKAAGTRMRNILEFFTRNRLVGTIVGMVFTAIIQSSSAATVMVVSFVNSGLMDLMQASGVILGANIGTTITGQLIAFDLSQIAPLFVISGVIMIMFCKKISVQRAGEVVLGFGILFMGLSIMGNSMTSLKESPRIVDMLRTLDNPFLAVLVGLVITAILQSSSATVGIIIVMAAQGLLQFTICPFLIVGCNIGACVSALLASLSGKKEAKRAALIHLLFNVIGSIIVFAVFMVGLEPLTDLMMQISGNHPARAVANTHTLIKICEVILLFPFMGWIVKATYRIVPGKDENSEKEYELRYIGKVSLRSPATATLDGIHEIERMGKLAIQNLSDGMDALCSPDEKKIQKVYQTEQYIDFLSGAITDYLVEVNELALPISDAKLMGGLFHVVNDIERIGDHAENFADSAKMRIEDHVVLEEKEQNQLMDMMAMVTQILEYSLEMFSKRNQEHMKEILRLEDEIDKKEKKLQRFHVKRLTKNKTTPQAGMIFSDTVSGLERVADHATNIAFAILEPDAIDEDDEDSNE